MSAGGFLLLRRGGSLWGIANAAVSGLERQAGGAYRFAAGPPAGSERELLVADEILGVVPDLRIWPSPVTRRFWSEPFRGLAIHGAMPVVVVDPGHPPGVLRSQGEDVGETEGRD